MRIQGGSSGLISAIVAGRLDPRDGRHEDERARHRWERWGGSDRRERLRRERYRAAKAERRERLLGIAQAASIVPY